MEGKLTHVRALVDERWQRVRRMQRQNDLLEARKQQLVQQLSVDIAAKRAQSDQERVALEIELLGEERNAERIHTELKTWRLQQKRAQNRHLAMQMQIQQYERSMKAETEKNELFWKQVLADQEVLKQEDATFCQSESKQRRERQRELVLANSQLGDVEAAVSTAKSENRNLQTLLANCQRRKRELLDELEETRQLNQSLRLRLAKEKQSNTGVHHQRQQNTQLQVIDLEQRADRILRELDEFSL